MEACPEVRDIEVAGAIRRWKETVGTIRVVASAKRTPALLIEHFLQLPSITEIEERTPNGCIVRWGDSRMDNVRVSLPLSCRGSIRLRCICKRERKRMSRKCGPWPGRKASISLTQLCLHAVAASEIGRPVGGRERVTQREVSLKKESDLFRHLGMQYIPPELREDEGEIELALAGKLPEDLLTIADIRGMDHCHTTYSDGRNSVEEMARAAEAMGMQYITITDHSPTAFYANGVKLDRLKRQWEEIESSAGDRQSKALARH